MKSVVVAAAAVAALAMPSAVHAAKTGEPAIKLSPQATQAAVRYALPHLVSSIRTTCKPHLSNSGFLARQGDGLVARYAAGSDAAWPAARAAMMQLGTKDKSGVAQMLGSMPDTALKPFIESTIVTMVGTKLQTKDCGDIERGLELLAPLPPENVAALAGFLYELSERDKKSKAR